MGQFEYVKLGAIPIWLRIQEQAYTYLVYDKQLKKVVEVVDSPFLEYPTHYFPKKKRTLHCSCGPHKKLPCFACAIERAYWDTINEKEAELKALGMNDVKIQKNPPMNRSMKIGLAVTGTDTYLELALMKDGKPRKNRGGDVIKKWTAEPLAGKAAVGTPEKDGHNMHWSFSNRALDQLEAFDDQLKNNCANCAADLYTHKMVCAGCGSIDCDFGDTHISGEDLLQLRAEEARCKRCNSKEIVPVLNCPSCGEPEEGGIMCFDLRLKAIPSGEKGRDLKLTGHRVPNYSPELQTLYETPLDCVKLFAPWPLSLQKSVLGELAEGVDPSHGAFTESYQKKEEEKKEDFPADDFGENDIPF